MVDPIEVLPTELLLHITKRLHQEDLARLARLSRNYQQVIEPILYDKLDFHRPQYHEMRPKMKRHMDAKWPLPSAELYPDERGAEFDSVSSTYSRKAYLFIRLFERRAKIKQSRMKYLAGLVRWLCLPICDAYLVNNWDLDGGYHSWRHQDPDHWYALAQFSNLKYLDLEVFAWSDGGVSKCYHRHVSYTSLQPMVNLQTVKLKGYVPAAFVQHVLSHASSITKLELGLLDEPHGSTESYRNPRGFLSGRCGNWRENPPRKLPDGYEVMNDSERRIFHKGMSEEDVKELEDLRHLNRGPSVAPRPLASLDPGTINQLTMTHLRLCKPADHDQSEVDMTDFTYFSNLSEARCLSQWAALIQAARQSLKVLVFDQRIFAVHADHDISSPEEHMCIFRYERSYDSFVETVLPVLLDESDWPQLEAIYLYGFELPEGYRVRENWPSVVEGEIDAHVDLFVGSVNIRQQLKDRFPHVRIGIAIGTWMFFDYGSGEVINRDEGCYPDDDEVSEEEEENERNEVDEVKYDTWADVERMGEIGMEEKVSILEE